MPIAVVFLLRAAVLVLLWGFVVATVVAVRHDVFGLRMPKTTAKPAAPVLAPPTAKPAAAAKPARKRKVAATSLAVVEGPSAGTSVTLSSLPVTIGRAAESTIVLSDDYVSNHHARLIPRGQEWLIEDVGSTNGTQLGDAKVTAPVVVPVGGLIRIGHNVLELR